MIASTMPLLTIHRKIEYRYARPAAFGEHRRDPRRAIPLHGACPGSADAYLGMDVSIDVVSAGEEAKV